MIFINARIHTLDGNRFFENGYVRIVEDKIESVGDMSSYESIDDKVIDLHRLDIYPGFVDAHSHIGILEDSLGFEGDDINEDTDPSTPQLRALDAVNPFDACFAEALEGGVTTVGISPGSANPIAGQVLSCKTYGKRIDDMIIKAPVAIKFALGENPKGTYSAKEQFPTTRMAVAALIYEQLNKAKQYYEDKLNYEKDSENFDKPEYDCKCEALIPLIRGEIKAHFHAHRADDIFTAIRIAKDFNIKYTVVHASEGHLISDELKGECADIFSGPFLSDRSKPELRALTPKTPGILSKCGLPVSVITDHPEIPEQYLPLCAALAVREGMDKEEALKAITIYPSESLGIDDRVGSIKEGKDADLVILRGNPLDFMNKPLMVVCNGSIVFNNL